jgi:glyceraldehyde-3-phosphate dehydrogenase (NADP+)
MLTVTNPFDGSVVGEVSLADSAALDAAIVKAQAAFEVTRRQKPFERSTCLSRAAELLRQHRAEFASLILSESGKPITLAEAEVDRGIITLTAAAEAARSSRMEALDLEGFAPGKGHIGFMKRFPIGVIYGMTPFNFPLNLVMHKVAPSVASGNAIIVKPSPRTPLTALRIEKLMRDAGCPENQVQVVVCPNELAMKLVEDERVKMVSFTGSAAVGWQIRKRAAARRVTLELGGNAALIIHDDADLTAAVPATAAGAFGYAGQTCISVQRILVQNDVYDRFRDMFLQHVREKIRAGDPRERTTVVGPMIDAAAIERVRATIDEAVRGGAKILLGGNVHGNVLEPTVLDHVDSRMTICTEEVFAPVATLHRYGNFDEAIAIANDSAYGLQAGVFTRDINRAWHAFESLDVGGVMINQVPTWRSDIMPYGGAKQSGLGREGVRYAMEEMTEMRAMVMKVE